MEVNVSKAQRDPGMKTSTWEIFNDNSQIDVANIANIVDSKIVPN